MQEETGVLTGEWGSSDDHEGYGLSSRQMGEEVWSPGKRYGSEI